MERRNKGPRRERTTFEVALLIAGATVVVVAALVYSVVKEIAIFRLICGR